MKATMKILSALIGGTVMAATLMGGMESLGVGNTSDISISAAEAERSYDGTAYFTVGKGVKCKSGEEVSVPVYMSLDKLASPKSVYKLCFNASYNKSALTFLGVERGGGLTGGMYGRSGNTVMFMALKGSMKVNSSKPICNLRFKVSDKADGSYTVKLVNHTGSSSSPIQIIHTHSNKKGNTYLNSDVTAGSVAVGETVDLGKVTGISADKTGDVSWDALPAASYYRVTKMVDGKAYDSGKITDTSYTMADVPESDFYVYVTAYDEKGNTAVSDSVMIYNAKQLGIPTNIAVSSDGVVSWTAAENAAYYTVTRVYKGKSSTSAKIKDTSYKLAQIPDSEYEVYVMSYDRKNCFLVSRICRVIPGEPSFEEKAPRPKKVTGVTADKDGSVTWDIVKDAAYYTVTRVYNGKSATSNKVTTESYNFVKVPDGNFTVYVTAYFDDGAKIVSDKVTVKVKDGDTPIEEPTEPTEPDDKDKLGEITEVGVNEDGAITWNEVRNAVYYTVSIKCKGEEKVSDSLTETIYIPDPMPDSDYEVLIIAYDAEGKSVKSDVYEIPVG